MGKLLEITPLPDNVVGFIPARAGSKAVKDKNLARLAGYPLIAHSILALKVAGFTKIYVSTDSSKIAKVSKLYGAEVIERPPELAKDDSPTEDAISHFIRRVPCNVVFMKQCTSPLVEPRHIRLAVNVFIDKKYDSMFSAVNTRKIDMLLWNGKMQPINYKVGTRSTRQKSEGRSTYYIETGGFYIFTPDNFKAYNNRLGGKIGIHEIPYHQSFEIDDAADLVFMERLF